MSGDEGQSVISFVIPIRPQPMATKIIRLANGRPKVMKTKKSLTWQANAALFIDQALAGMDVIDEPVEIQALYYFAPSQSWSKKKKSAALSGKLRPTTKTVTGDIDNLTKNILDALVTNGHLKDDSLVVSLFAAKYYSNEERTEVRIKKLTEEER